MLGAKARLKDAERVKKFLVANDLIDNSYQYDKDDNHIFFPLSDGCEYEALEVVEHDFEEREVVPSWREAARDLLTPDEHALGRFSYDTVGSIAIIEVVDELLAKEVQLAELLLATDPRIKTVLKKGSGHVGELRTQQMVYLAGEDTRETIVSENSVRLWVNVETVYYSVRLGTERNRIMKLIREGEDVLCMFSGVGPYPVVFAKNTGASRIVAIELNPEGHRLALKNNALNNVDVEFHCGDVAQVVPQIIKDGSRFDRITMPLPHTGVEFLPLALEAIRSGGVIHYYCFIEHEAEKEISRIHKILEENDVSAASITPVICGQHSPRRYRVCYDIVIS